MVDVGNLELELDVTENEDETEERNEGESEENEEAMSAFAAPRQNIYDLTVLDAQLVDAAISKFHQHDENDDGLLTPIELQNVFEDLQMSESETLREILTEMKAGPIDSGIIDLDEFVTILRMVVASMNSDDEDTRFSKAFRSFDRDDNGVLDVKELQQVLNMLGNRYSQEEVERVFEEMDQDKNGTVDYAEFVQFLASKKLDDAKP